MAKYYLRCLYIALKFPGEHADIKNLTIHHLVDYTHDVRPLAPGHGDKGLIICVSDT